MAKLIEGAYTGFTGYLNDGIIIIGETATKTSYSNNTSFYFYSGSLWANYPNKNSFVLSGISAGGWDDYQVKISDAYSIDLKIDDGKPYLGQVITYSNVDGECVPLGQRLNTVPTLNNIAYQLTDLTDLCTMHFSLEKSF